MSNKSPQKQPPASPPKGKGVKCNVFLLDGECIEITLDKNDVGRALFDKVCTHLDLIEKDYFGFTYTDDRGPSHLKYWLNLDKKISKQKKRGAWVFEFALKFYPPDPSNLRESLTRWLVVLQVRRDLLSGRLPCTFTTYALLGSYNVQADVGEYDPNDHGHSYDYIKDMAFAPNQTPELQEKIAELHKQHKGLTPDEAEKCFLDNAKKLAMYGVDLHKAKDSENEAIMLGVCASGILVYRDKLRINRFVWPKILKLSYKRNHFYIKIRPGELERNEHTIMFKLDNHRLAKRLWKTCVEHHAFFRLRESEKPNHNPSFPRFGSKFRYSGRTLYQTRQTAALLDRPPPFFERSQPARNTIADTGNRSRSVDELANRRNKDPYGDGMYDGKRGSQTYDPHRGSKNYDPNRSGDENDRRDQKGVPTAFEQANRHSGMAGDGEGDTLQRRPNDGSDTADRRDRTPSQGDATLEREGRQGRGDDSMGIVAGNVEGKPETDKERRKREKEEDKRRKKEAEEKKKKEEEERKRLEKEKKKKKGKGDHDDLDTSEDRIDQKDGNEAKETAFGVGAGNAGLEGGNVLLRDGKDGTGDDKDKDKSKRPGSGYGGPDDKDRNRGSRGDPDGLGKDGRKRGSSHGDPDSEGRHRYGPGYGSPDSYDREGLGRNPDDGSKLDRDGKGRGSGRDGGKDKDKRKHNDRDHDKDKDKDKKGGGGLFGRKKGKDKDKHGNGDEGDSPYGKGGKDGDKDKSRFGKSGYPDEPDGLRDKKKETKSEKEKKQSPTSNIMASLCVGRSPSKKGGKEKRTSVSSSSSDAAAAEALHKDVLSPVSQPVTASVDLADSQNQGNLVGATPGAPYGVGLGVGKGDMTGVVGKEGTVENKQRFLPLPEPIRETKESLKSGYTDNMMPFFSPAATSTVGRSKVPPPVPPKGNHSFDDSFNKSDPPTVATEKVKYNPNLDTRPLSSRNVPLVKTETRTVTYERNGCPSDLDEGMLVSAQSHSSRLQTIETTTYKTEKDGVEETRVVQKVVMSGDEDEDFDFDAALADAIRSVTEFNPDMSVERIECVQQIEDVKDGK